MQKREPTRSETRCKQIIDKAVDVLKTLPKDEMQLTKSELNKIATDTGNL